MAVAAFIFVVALCCVFNTHNTQSPVWFGPYLSAAANLDVGGVMRIDAEEVVTFKNMNVAQQEAYRFQESPSTIPYTYNDVGFVYIVYFAKIIFPFLSDQGALEALQIAVHGFITAFIIYRLRSPLHQLSFTIIYGINPLIIYFVTFPFYYFWQVVASFAFLLVLLKVDQGRWPVLQRVGIIIFCAVLGIIALTRPSTLPVLVFTFAIAFVTMKWKGTLLTGAAAGILVIVVLYVPAHRNVWHTAYVGWGAYPNPFGLEYLSDDFGYALFERETGTVLNASIGGNMYNKDVMDQYKDIARKEYLRLSRSAPLLMARNALLNILQSFSVGYITDASPWTHYLVAGSGALVIAALLVSGQYLLFVAIGLASGSFALYVPPIPAYMFGSYILLVIGGLRFLDYIHDRWLKRRIDG